MATNAASPGATGATALTRAPIATLNALHAFCPQNLPPDRGHRGLACAFAWAAFVETRDHDAAALCGGRRYEISRFPNGLSPYVALTADGVPGQFLLDYGATRSSLSADAFARSAGSVKTAAISLPSFEKGDFRVARYDQPVQSREGGSSA